MEEIIDIIEKSIIYSNQMYSILTDNGHYTPDSIKHMTQDKFNFFNNKVIDLGKYIIDIDYDINYYLNSNHGYDISHSNNIKFQEFTEKNYNLFINWKQLDLLYYNENQRRFLEPIPPPITPPSYGGKSKKCKKSKKSKKNKKYKGKSKCSK